MTTNSGAGSNCCQYRFAPSFVMWSRTWRACACTCAAARVLVLGLERVEVGGQRRLRVDDDVLAARQLDDEVGAEHAPVGVGRRRLLVEVAVREHPGELDDALELDLAPAAAHVRRAERGAQVAGLGAELLLPLRERLHLLGQRPVGALTLLVERLRLLVERPSASSAIGSSWVRASWRKESLFRWSASAESALNVVESSSALRRCAATRSRRTSQTAMPPSSAPTTKAPINMGRRT